MGAGGGMTEWRRARLCITCAWFRITDLFETGTPDRGMCEAPELKTYDLVVSGRGCRHYEEGRVL